MRVKLLNTSQKKFFDTIIKIVGISDIELAKKCNTNRRTLFDWKTGATLIPLKVFNKLLKISNTRAPQIEVLPEYWYAKKAGQKGGRIVQQLYGNPGTPEGRSKGGKTTFQKFFKNPSLAKKVGFITRKDINFPKKSARLSEFIGIILGDGGISKYQTAITLHNIDDKEFSLYVAGVIENLFNVKPGLYKQHSVVNIVISRKNLIEFLLKQGLQIGSKVRHQIDVPTWIKEKDIYAKNCARGLFDTDGCFYVDKHVYNGKVYFNPAINFTNRSLPLLHFFKTTLEKFGFHPTQRTAYSVFLRKEKEIYKFFKDIGSSNPKHIKKFVKYFTQKYGEVPKWS